MCLSFQSENSILYMCAIMKQPFFYYRYLTFRTALGLKPLKKMLVIFLYWFTAQQPTSTFRDQKSGFFTDNLVWDGISLVLASKKNVMWLKNVKTKDYLKIVDKHLPRPKD